MIKGTADDVNNPKPILSLCLCSGRIDMSGLMLSGKIHLACRDM